MSIITRTHRPVKPSRVTPQRSAFGVGIIEPKVARYAGEHKPTAEEFAPSAADRAWAEESLRGVFDAPAVNEGPTFIAALQLASRRFRAGTGEMNAFIATELDRLAALAAILGAANPTDFDRKRDLAEMNARECWEARGYDAGHEAARGEYHGLPVID
jgi:hypothetical protein